ncbi:piggyBac transposable element-derived protein 4-like [Physella acuta]|uniref:piggyBac transposable element-derived protein 4-like n=1 Tax=Physella acuta TaxID=109671 RepID=UPI0027DE74A5|nr:piggyBac transposable element-derived protein 4-like [Physella acuta]
MNADRSSSESGESDIECEEGDIANNELDLDLSDTDDLLNPDDGDEVSLDVDNPSYNWSDDLNPVEIEMFTSGVGPNMGDINLNYKSQPIDFFKLFFSDELLELIANQTNLYAVQASAKNFTPVSMIDVSTFIYINMMFGIHKLPAYHLYWSTDNLFRVPCVADVMSRNRYQEISRYFHLADNTKYIPKGQINYDPLFKIRPAITTIQFACKEYFRPGTAISFDEAMIPFRGRLSFKQYIKGKPHPWGVKVWCACDSATSYLLDFEFYAGKSDTALPNGLGYHVIWSLGQRFLHKYHHFYYDNFFSSIKLSVDLMTNDTYSCGTIRQNRKHWPKELTGKLKVNHCEWRQIDNLVACWWRDKRAISMLSTNASPVWNTASRRTKDGAADKQIPQAVLVYNANMGGVDRHDQLRSYYPIGRKSHKWWRCCLWFLLEVAVLNSYILFCNIPRPPTVKPLTHLQYHMSVARSLMKGSSRKRIQRESTTTVGLAVSGASVEHHRIRLPGRKKVCYQCRQKDVRTEGSRRPETVFGCVLCNTHLCDELCFAQFHVQLK